MSAKQAPRRTTASHINAADAVFVQHAVQISDKEELRKLFDTTTLVDSRAAHQRGELERNKMIKRKSFASAMLFPLIVMAAGCTSKPAAYNCHDIRVGGESETVCLPNATLCNQSRVSIEANETDAKTTECRPEPVLWCFEETPEGNANGIRAAALGATGDIRLAAHCQPTEYGCLKMRDTALRFLETKSGPCGTACERECRKQTEGKLPMEDSY